MSDAEWRAEHGYRQTEAMLALEGELQARADEIARLRVLLAWEAGVLSEGQAARALSTDRVTLRGWREEALAGLPPPDDDEGAPTHE